MTTQEHFYSVDAWCPLLFHPQEEIYQNNLIKIWIKVFLTPYLIEKNVLFVRFSENELLIITTVIPD